MILQSAAGHSRNSAVDKEISRRFTTAFSPNVFLILQILVEIFPKQTSLDQGTKRHQSDSHQESFTTTKVTQHHHEFYDASNPTSSLSCSRIGR